MWSSSLTDSTSKGKPDIEAVNITTRMHGLTDILECTTKPIIYDGDTGSKTEHFVFTVRTLERNGISAVIIEDKIGSKSCPAPVRTFWLASRFRPKDTFVVANAKLWMSLVLTVTKLCKS